jgi:L-rhamnose mutarotase
MSVHPGAEAAYAQRHNPIWKHLEVVLKTHGVQNYSIFLLQDSQQVSAYAEIESESQWAAIAATRVCEWWWRYMAPLMPHNPDGSPVTHETREVFHLD